MRFYGLGLGSGRRVVMWAEALPVTPAVEVHKGFLFRDIDLEDARRVPSADLARTRTHRQTRTRRLPFSNSFSNARRGPPEHTAQDTRDQRARRGGSYMSSRTSYAVHLSPAECTCCEREQHADLAQYIQTKLREGTDSPPASRAACGPHSIGTRWHTRPPGVVAWSRAHPVPTGSPLAVHRHSSYQPQTIYFTKKIRGCAHWAGRGRLRR